ncbi:Peptidogalycan biosysnthesis/recognition [Rhizobium multihospitium]|uniref:Peptidogalycan biosysnthesis/recognition n=2 Tax=Rhizobium multihospitium TaxID=410764 RepID=A0A1C3XBG1_9HYPH|nr:Peptidogalycan biosysnthesis/recognition [Rhizobium multihospitium]
MSVRFYHGFNAVEWASLRARSPTHGTSWLSAMASRLPGDLYTVISDQKIGFIGTIVKDANAYEAYNPAAIFWRDEPVFPIADSIRRIDYLKSVREGYPPTLPALVLVAPGYVGDPAGANVFDEKVASCVLVEIVDWARALGLSSVHILYTTNPTIHSAVRELSGVSYSLATRSILKVTWDNWDGYLGKLPSKKRVEFRKEWRRAADELSFGEFPASEFVDDIVEGRCAVLQRYGQSASSEAELSRLKSLIAAFGSNVIAYGGLAERRLEASCLCLRDGRCLNALYSSLTESGRKVPYAHLAATYYAIIRHNPAAVCDEIDYGIGHRETKEARGCIPITLYGHAIPLKQGGVTSFEEAASYL